MSSHGQNPSRRPEEKPVYVKISDGDSSDPGSHGGDRSRGPGGPPGSTRTSGGGSDENWFPASARYKRLSDPIPGGMGVVYKALDVNLDVEVAIKRIRPEFAANEDLLSRFEREAKTQVRLRHANLVQVRDYAIDEIGPYIVMDWIEGQSLAQLVKDGPIEWKKAARIVGKCAMALHVAHEAGIIHRDIKPANILLNASGEPFVTDFGLVRIEAEHSTTGETVTGALLGTVDFMAPEQLEDPRKASFQSDIWSLGATLYRITTGRSVRGMRESLIPTPIRDVVLRAMEENPGDRFSSMKKLSSAIRDELNNQPRRASSLEIPVDISPELKPSPLRPVNTERKDKDPLPQTDRRQDGNRPLPTQNESGSRYHRNDEAVSQISYSAWLAAYIVGLTCAFGSLLIVVTHDPNDFLRFVVAIGFLTAVVCSIWSGVSFCRTIFRMWSVFGGPGRPTPGKAVGLLFVPYYNAYWLYVVYARWAAEYESWRSAHPNESAPRCNVKLAKMTALLSATGLIPFLGIIGVLGSLVLWPISFKNVTHALNYAVAHVKR